MGITCLTVFVVISAFYALRTEQHDLCCMSAERWEAGAMVCVAILMLQTVFFTNVPICQLLGVDFARAFPDRGYPTDTWVVIVLDACVTA